MLTVQSSLPLPCLALAVWAEPENGNWCALIYHKGLDRERKEFLLSCLVVWCSSNFKEQEKEVSFIPGSATTCCLTLDQLPSLGLSFPMCRVRVSTYWLPMVSIKLCLENNSSPHLVRLSKMRQYEHPHINLQEDLRTLGLTPETRQEERSSPELALWQSRPGTVLRPPQTQNCIKTCS